MIGNNNEFFCISILFVDIKGIKRFVASLNGCLGSADDSIVGYVTFFQHQAVENLCDFLALALAILHM